MKNIFSSFSVSKIVAYAKTHKIITVVVAVALIGGGWWGYGKVTASSTETQYVLGTVEKGTIVSSISGSGQVSASNELVIQTKATGDIISVHVSAGQRVVAGQLIAVIDPTDAQNAVRDAEVNLESAQLSLDKLLEPAGGLSLVQAENKLAQAQESKADAEAALEKAYDDGFNDVADAFLDLPEAMSGLQDILFSYDASQNYENLEFYGDATGRNSVKAGTYKQQASDNYDSARKAYDANFEQYKGTNRFSSRVEIEELISETYDTAKLIAEAVKSANNLIQLYRDETQRAGRTPVSISATHLTELNTYTGTTNSQLVSLLSAKDAFENQQQTITNAERTIVETSQSLADLKAGADELDIRSARLTITQRENTLADAKQNLADSYVRAPFAGTIASLSAKKYAAASGELATLITDQKIAELSLNEVDAAKIELGDKATLTFDAIEELTLTGKVAQIDTIGAVTQGVVSYKVKIGFDTQEERVKPGMTVNASIQTDTKQDVLIVPSSAVKTQNGVSYVQVFNPALPENGGAQGVTSKIVPQQIEVVTGISDDTNVEIISGLEEGQQIVTRTISASAANTGATSGNANRGGALGAPPSGAIRF